MCAVRRVRRRAHAECSAEKLLHARRGIGPLPARRQRCLCCFIGEEYAVEHEMGAALAAAGSASRQRSRRLCRQRYLYEILSELKESIAARKTALPALRQ